MSGKISTAREWLRKLCLVQYALVLHAAVLGMQQL